MSQGVSRTKRSIQCLTCNWEIQRPNAFSYFVGILNAAGFLEDAVSPRMVPGQSPGGARGKASESFEICSKF